MEKEIFKVKSSYVKFYPEPPINRKEILRYAGAKEETKELKSILEDCLSEACGRLSYRVCFSEVPVKKSGEMLDLTFLKTESKDLGKNLIGCQSVVVFAATVGVEIDRLIERYKRLSPAKALIFQAIGAERIESLCDVFSQDIKARLKEEEKYTRPRFSPGYGDFPLEKQKDIFAYLECAKKIGVSLNSSLLMSPSKSVTALIGISDCKMENENSEPCKTCKKVNCTFRR